MRYAVGVVLMVVGVTANAGGDASVGQSQLNHLTQQCKNNLSACTELANNGDYLLQFVLGQMYEFGDGVEANSQSSDELYSKAAVGGTMRANFELSKSYFRGDLSEQEYWAAKAWLGEKEHNQLFDGQYLRQMILIGTDGAANHPWRLEQISAVTP